MLLDGDEPPLRRHASKACSQLPSDTLHLSLMVAQVLDLTMFSTLCSCLMSDASCWVRGSLGK